jgi:EmrB/QacA subfamily drug resistance transporter
MQRGWKVLGVTSIGTFTVTVDTSILNVAFRSLVKDFGPGARTQLTWVLSGYSIAFAAALLTAGRLGDRFGRKRAYLLGLAVFGVASGLCAMAPNPPMLIAARILQAIGGALLVPAALALVLPEFPPEKRSTAIGISGAVGGLGAAFGPVLGGVLVDNFGWRSVFTVNIPIVLVGFVLGARILRESKDSTATKLPDPIGGVLAIAGFGLLTASIVQGDEWGWGSVAVLGSAAAAIGLLVAFVFRSRTHPVPVVDLSLFKLKFFSAANLSLFLFSMGFYGMFFNNVSFLQGAWGFSPMKSGFASSPGPIMAALFSVSAGRWAAKFGHKKVIVAGLSIFAFGIALSAVLVTKDPSYFTTFFPAYLVTGIGVGFTIATLGSAANAYLPPNRFGMGSAISSTGRQIAAALGIAVVSAINIAGRNDPPLETFRRVSVVIVVLMVLSALAMLVMYVKPTTAEIDASRVGAPVPAAGPAPV